MRNGLPDLFGDERHEGVEQTQYLIENIHKHLTRVLGVLSVAVQSCFGKLDVPVAVAVPDKLVNLLNSHAELELFEILVNFLGYAVKSREYPLVLGGEHVGKLVLYVKVVNVHVNIARGVPKLICKARASLDSLFGVADIISR